MSQLHCYVPEELANQFRKKAEQSNLSASKYLAMLVRKEVENKWPESYFELFGAWEGEALERPKLGEYETRQKLE